MTRRFFDVENLCPLAVDGQNLTHQATLYFLTAALDDEVLMREEESKKRGSVMSGKALHNDRGFLGQFFLPDANNS